MKHPLEIEKYDGTMKELARDIANLRYDALYHFLHFLSLEILEDAYKDFKRDRRILSGFLNKTASSLIQTKLHVENAWNICTRKMEK